MALSTNITLAKALKVKNRLAGRLPKLQLDVQTYNSVVVGTESPDVKALYALYQEIKAALVRLKAAINHANQDVQPVIYEMAEAKATIAFLATLNTRHGTQPGYTGTAVTFAAALRKVDVDAEVRRLEQLIDARQDQLDQHNHATGINIDTRILELAG